MGIYLGVNNVGRKVPKLYVGVNNVARKVKKVYIGVNNVARLVYTSSVVDGIPTVLGQTVDWGGYNWTVVHVTQDIIYMIMTNIHSMRQSGDPNDNTGYMHIRGLLNACNEVYSSLPAAYQNVLCDVSLFTGINAQKVFVAPQNAVCNDSGSHRILPTFDWFNFSKNVSSANRIATYNGVATTWWTSTTAINELHGSFSWAVSNTGTVTYTGYPLNSLGFRPCIAVNRHAA